MPTRVDRIQTALAAPTRSAVLAALSPRRPDLSLPEVMRLSQHLKQLNEPRQPLRMGVIRTYTTDLLRPYWNFESLLTGFELDLYEAPFGSLVDEARPGSELGSRPADVVYFFLKWEDLDPRLVEPLAALSADERKNLQTAAVDRLESILQPFREALTSPLVVSFLPRFLPRELGLHDPMAADSEAGFFAALKQRIAERLREGRARTIFADLDEVVAEIGRGNFFDRRLWLTSQAPFSVSGSQAVVRHLLSYAIVLKRPRAKCILLDADNTLWGGVVGEDGLTGIALGPEYPGSAFVAFQRRLLHFQQRGLLLALCSKNNPDDVSEVLRDHPHQVLRERHFATMRVNWENKNANVRSIAEELNLGIDSFVFVDDSPHECLSLSQAFPEMTVVQVPEQPVDVPFCLDELTQLEVLRLTDEDRQRTALYAADRARKEHSARSCSPEEYLASLRMVMTVAVDDRSQIARLAQLTQKTNQFNLTTRRYTEAEIEKLMGDAESVVTHFSLADVFGDSGIVGLAIVTGLGQAAATIDTFLMSCRVIGRRAESAFLRRLLELIAGRGVRRVCAAYIPTRKNGLVRSFWLDHGFTEIEPGQFEIEPGKLAGPEAPIGVVLKESSTAPARTPASQPLV